MFIHEMSELECRQALEHATVARLACAIDNQPYIVPVYFALDREYIYAFTSLGQKIEWMRTNPLVCLEIDERSSHSQWHSVIVFGRYEELPEDHEYEAARVKAHEVLQKHPMWWEPACVGAAHRDLPHSETPVFYRIRIDRVTGHRATPDLAESAAFEAEREVEVGWWPEILRHLGLKN